MKSSEFSNVLKDTFEKVEGVLDSKKKEYTPQLDRLSNFKVAASLQGISNKQALLGMVAKHMVSVADYIQRDAAGEEFTVEQWDEKIIDVINYMVLLRGLIIEDESYKTFEACDSEGEFVMIESGLEL